MFLSSFFIWLKTCQKVTGNLKLQWLFLWSLIKLKPRKTTQQMCSINCIPKLERSPIRKLQVNRRTAHIIYRYLIFGRYFRGRDISVPPFRRRRFGAGQLGAGHFGAVSYFFFFELWRKNNEAGNFLNAVEREPVETSVEYYRKTNPKKKVLAPDSHGAEMSGD